MVKKELLTIPNILTFFRLLAGPVCFYLVWIDKKNFALFLFILAVLSDKADGIFARKKKQATAFGETLDPIADNSLVVFTGLALILKKIVDFYFLKYIFFILLIYALAIGINSFKIKRLNVPKIFLGTFNIFILYLVIIYIFLGLPINNLFINIVLIYTFIVSLVYLVYSIKFKTSS